MAAVHSIYRYPVKGLNAEPLHSVILRPGTGIQGDRAYAIAHGNTEFDPGAPMHLRKIKFLTLMTHPRLAELKVTWQDHTGLISFRKNDQDIMQVDLNKSADVAKINKFLNDFIGSEAKGAPKLVTAPDFMFTDVKEDCLSIINLASVHALSENLGQKLDPLRFRANIYLDGLLPWAERSWREGDEFTLASCRLRIMRPIVRCAATNVDPTSAIVDVDIPTTLRRSFEQNLMGIYVEVLTGGTIKPGDLMEKRES